MTGHYQCTCYDGTGRTTWSSTVANTITKVGFELIFDTALRASTPYQPVGFMGIIGALTGTPSTDDTMASHATWTEGSFLAARVAPTWNPANNGTKATQTVRFDFNGTGTVKGLFLIMSAPAGGNAAVATVGDTHGVLYSAGAMAEGDLGPVADGHHLDVTYTTDIAA
jgi:hypothetical protein